MSRICWSHSSHLKTALARAEKKTFGIPLPFAAAPHYSLLGHGKDRIANAFKGPSRIRTILIGGQLLVVWAGQLRAGTERVGYRA